MRSELFEQTAKSLLGRIDVLRSEIEIASTEIARLGRLVGMLRDDEACSDAMAELTGNGPRAYGAAGTTPSEAIKAFFIATENKPARVKVICSATGLNDRQVRNVFARGCQYLGMPMIPGEPNSPVTYTATFLPKHTSS